MSERLNELLKDLERTLNCQQEPTDPSVFFNLLFNGEDIVQIKLHNRIHPADAEYIAAESGKRNLDDWTNKHSEAGIQFCLNAVPPKFLDKMNYLQEVVSSEQPQWDRLIPALRDELSLAATLFDEGRTFFIEADCMPSGEYIKTTGDKIAVLTELLSSDLPISYILDTGGRGPHIGIVLEQPVNKAEFDQTVTEVMQRLPHWIDCGVGRVNQMERMPNTTRINKTGEVAIVRLIHLGQRVQNDALKLWLDTHPVINSNLAETSPLNERDWLAEIDAEDPEEAAWAFIRENNLKSSKRVSNGKIQVRCPKSENHKSGKDSNMSAVIFVQEGHIWCSACQGTVGRTFKAHSIRKARQSPLILSTAESVDLSLIKPVRIF